MREARSNATPKRCCCARPPAVSGKFSKMPVPPRRSSIPSVETLNSTPSIVNLDIPVTPTPPRLIRSMLTQRTEDSTWSHATSMTLPFCAAIRNRGARSAENRQAFAPTVCSLGVRDGRGVSSEAGPLLAPKIKSPTRISAHAARTPKQPPKPARNPPPTVPFNSPLPVQITAAPANSLRSPAPRCAPHRLRLLARRAAVAHSSADSWSAARARFFRASKRSA